MNAMVIDFEMVKFMTNVMRFTVTLKKLLYESILSKSFLKNFVKFGAKH